LSRLVVYDFDGTIFRSPCRLRGEKLYRKHTGNFLPFAGWWGRIESLSFPVVPLLPDLGWYNGEVVSSQRNDKLDISSDVVLMTGRPVEMSGRIRQLCEHGGMVFDDYFFCDGYAGKCMAISGLLQGGYDVLELWEDRCDHIDLFNIFGDSLVRSGVVSSFVVHGV
jgi:hypothetical protein